MSKNRIINLFQGIGIFIAIISIGFIFISNKQSYNFKYDPIHQNIKSLQLNDNYNFAGESVPIQNFDVAERLERELLANTFQHSGTVIHLKLAMRYFPEISKILKEEGLPDDFKYLAVAESSLRNAVSSAGAKGMWQFRDAAAKELNLEINEWVDERNHFEKSTRAACGYLKKLKTKFGSWTLAAAAYNMGPSGLQNAIDEQKETSYYDLNLNDETNRYVFRILGAKEILANPDKFGFYIQNNEGYFPLENYKIVEHSGSITNLADFAHQNNCTYRMLKVYNPWLTKSNLVNKTGKKYSIRIPN